MCQSFPSKKQASCKFMASVTVHSDFETQENKISLLPLFPLLFAMKWWDQMPWFLFVECWVLNQLFHSPLSPSSRGSLLSVIRVVSSACLRLLIFVPAILIPACDSSSLAFLMEYSAYKINKQGVNIQPCCYHFLIWNQFFVPCLILTVASWPSYRFLKRQVRWSGITISLRIFHSCDPHSQRL